MSSIQEIKRRIKAVTNTSQITKAMEMVSATKMRRSQEVALLSRPYSVEVLRILGELSLRTPYLPEIMQGRPIKKTAIVLVAADRGLAGSFNANVFRAFERWLIVNKEKAHSFVCFSVGKKAEEFLNRKSLTARKAFKNFGDHVEVAQTQPLTNVLVQGYLKHEWDEVVLISTHFRTTLRQEVMTREILPINVKKIREIIREIVPEYGRYSGQKNGTDDTSPTKTLDYEYLIEPSPKEVLDKLAPELVEIALYDFILEANASEHSARMVAMKNASENAAELKDDLTIEYNKSRQAGITREISEIVSGAEALKS